ncbi:MAG: FmdB family zinc ribbon protein [Bacillota bacterium]
MPTYDFICKDCSHKFSRFLSVKDKNSATCPLCTSGNVGQRYTGFFYAKSGGSGDSSSGGGGGGGGCSKSSCGGCSGC